MFARLPSLSVPLPAVMRALDPRPLAARVFALTALAFLAACDIAVPVSSGGFGQPFDRNRPVQVALLVPGGTGVPEFDRLAVSLENAARMAIADLNGAQINLTVYNTARSPEQAAQVASRAVAEGAQIILGPLDALSANAVGIAVAPSNVNVLAYSNNTEIAQKNPNVFVLGKTFGNVSDRLVSYAASRGIDRFLIVHQDDPQGTGAVGRDAIATSVQSSGGTIAGIESYAFSQSGIFARASAIAATVANSGAQAVFVTDTIEGGLAILSASLMDRGVSGADTPLIGLAQWDATSAQAAILPGLQNGLFAKSDEILEQQFSDRYQATYGQRPLPISSVAYDGIAAIGALAATGDRNALTTESLTRASGFIGATGIFRLRPDGTNQRALAVARIVDNRVMIVDPAPQFFGRGGS